MQRIQEGAAVDSIRPDDRWRLLTRGYSRRDVVRRGGVVGLTAAAVAGWARGHASAQDATPVAEPVENPAASPVASPIIVTGEARFAYVGTYTRDAPGGGGTATAEGISVFAVAPGTGALSLVETIPSDNPSFLALDPAQNVLYAVNEIDDFEGGGNGSVEAYAIDPATGQLSLINREDVGGAIPAHLAVDPTGSDVVVANYVGGNFTVLPIREDGGLDPVSDSVQNTGSGPNAERQEAPHPHVVVFDPVGGFVATADLGIDLVQVFRLDTTTGELEPVSEVSVAPGAGPRHASPRHA